MKYHQEFIIVVGSWYHILFFLHHLRDLSIDHKLTRQQSQHQYPPCIYRKGYSMVRHSELKHVIIVRLTCQQTLASTIMIIVKVSIQHSHSQDVFSILQQLMTNFGVYYLTSFVVLTYIADITIFVARRHIN